MTDLDKVAEQAARLRAQLPKCECECGCQYPLMGTRSKDAGRCFSCRARVHFGGRPLFEEDE